MGYESKACISPNQVKRVNKAFKNDSKQIKRARDIVEIFEKNKENGVTGFVDEEYGFIDEPIYKGALALLNKYICTELG